MQSEREEDNQSESSSDDEESLEEEEEPVLKYTRLAAGIKTILAEDRGARVLKAHDKFLVLGTKAGNVYLLDFRGDKIKQWKNHKKQVNDISISGDNIASCSDDGRVVIRHVFDHEDETDRPIYNKNQMQERAFPKSVKSVSLIPDYDAKQNFFFCSGGLCDQLIITYKKIWGKTDQVLHAGEGPVHAIEWRKDLIAWANARGVKIYDYKTRQRLAYIARENSNISTNDNHRCCLFWQDDTHLLIGWDDTVKIAEVKSGVGSKGAASTRQVQILRKFRFDVLICGVANWDDKLVVLAYTEAESDSEDDANPMRKRRPDRPELRIIGQTSKEPICEDVLPIQGFEDYTPDDYRLEVLRNSHETFFYIVSPKTLLVATPRDITDHVNWLVDNLKYVDAIQCIEENAKQLRDFRQFLSEVGERYLNWLMSPDRFIDNDPDELKNLKILCPKIFGDNQSQWEKWILNFLRLNQLQYIIDCIPVRGRTKLRAAVYEKVLLKLLFQDKELFLKKIHDWPVDIYNVENIIGHVNSNLHPDHSDPATTVILKKSLAELYLKNGQVDKTLECYLDLQQGPIFRHIITYGLYDVLKNKIMQLIKFAKANNRDEDNNPDPGKAIELLVDKRKEIPMGLVVGQLQQHPELLFQYLDSVFQIEKNDTLEFSDQLFKLYAIYKPENLFKFLLSNDPKLDEAYHVCQERIDNCRDEETRKHFYEAKVHILERMGNSKLALSVLVQNLKNVKKAIEFVERSKDSALWDDLIQRSLDSSGEFVSELLDCIGGSAAIEPVKLIEQIPPNMQIPKLAQKVTNLLEAYAVEVSIREGANNILKSDCSRNITRKIRSYKGGHACLTKISKSDTKAVRVHWNGQLEIL